MATKIYLFPANRLSLEDLRKTLKQIKHDARANKAASNVEGEK